MSVVHCDMYLQCVTVIFAFLEDIIVLGFYLFILLNEKYTREASKFLYVCRTYFLFDMIL